MRRGREVREVDKLGMLLRMWEEKKPDTYEISRLKTVLAEEVNKHSEPHINPTRSAAT